MTAARVVLDTNCVVSALVFPSGRFVGLRQGWQMRRFIPLASRDTAAELLRVLAYRKFRLTPDEQQSLLADYLPWVQTVHLSAMPPDLPPIRDPADVKFLALARAAQADALVTGDADLLEAREQFGVPILTVAQFEGWLQEFGPIAGM